MKLIPKILWVFAMVLFFALSAYSQTPPPNPVAAPLDGFSTYLVVLGTAYAYSKLNKSDDTKN